MAKIPARALPPPPAPHLRQINGTEVATLSRANPVRLPPSPRPGGVPSCVDGSERRPRKNKIGAQPDGIFGQVHQAPAKRTHTYDDSGVCSSEVSLSLPVGTAAMFGNGSGDEEKLRRILREEMRGTLEEMLSRGLLITGGGRVLPEAPGSSRSDIDAWKLEPRGPVEASSSSAIQNERAGQDTASFPSRSVSPVPSVSGAGSSVGKTPSSRKGHLDESDEPAGDATDILKEVTEMSGPQSILRRLLPPQQAAQLQWLLDQQEPERTGKLADFISGRFDIICTLVIILNVIVTFFNVNWHVKNYGQTSSFFSTVDALFLCFYILELTLKLIVHRQYFFWNANMQWNLFDFFLVCTGLYDQSTSLTGEEGIDLVYLRVLRLLKMARILRVFRLVRSLSVLRLILNSCLGSMSSLLWSIVMMCIILFMFGLVFVQNTSSYFADNADRLSETDMEGLRETFGSVELAMLTLFKASTGGDDWGNSYHVLEPLGFSTCGLYLFFVCFMQIALMNILTGIFVENAMSLAQPDRQAMYSEEQKEYIRRVQELNKLIQRMDLGDDGCISFDEFHKAMTDTGPDSLRTYFGANGIQHSDAENFFKMLMRMDPKVDVNTFVAGCLKLKGQAQSFDLQALICETKIVHRKICAMHKDVLGIEEEMQEVEKEVEKDLASTDKSKAFMI